MGITGVTGSAPSVTLNAIGEFTEGTVVDTYDTVANNFDRAGNPTGPATWDDSRPKQMWAVVYKLDQPDPSIPGDDGLRTDRIKRWGANKKKFVDTVVTSGVDGDLAPGGRYRKTLVGLDTSTNPAAKLYEYSYTKPAPSGGINVSAPVSGATVSAPPAAVAPPAPPVAAPPAPPAPPAANPFAGVATDLVSRLSEWMRKGWTDEQLVSPAGAGSGADQVSRETLAAIRAAL